MSVRETLDIHWEDNVLDEIVENEIFDDDKFEFHGFDLIEHNGERIDPYIETLILKRKIDGKLFATCFTRGEFGTEWIYEMREVEEVEKVVKTYV